MLQQEQEDKQKNLDEAQHQIEEISEQKENLQQLLNEKETEKANLVELLADADVAIERHKERQRNEVVKIPSRDIRLTRTELGRGAYGGEKDMTNTNISYSTNCYLLALTIVNCIVI